MLFLALLLATPSFASIEIPKKLSDDFFDSLLRESTVSFLNRLPDVLYTLNPVLDVSVSLKRVTLQGPSKLQRHGSTYGTHQSQILKTSGIVSLGEVHYGAEMLVDFFRYRWSTPILLTLKDAKYSVYVHIEKDAEECQAYAGLSGLSASPQISFGYDRALNTFEKCLSYFLQQFLSAYVSRLGVYSDVMRTQLERGIADGAENVSCPM